MAEIQIKVTVPDGALCYDRGKQRSPCRLLGFGRCEVFGEEVIVDGGKFYKVTQCMVATILPDKSPNECEVCGRPKSADCCGSRNCDKS